jgi:hypothetical protein
MFGSNENLIFILSGDPYNPILHLYNDSTGSPVYLWSIYVYD